MTYKMVLIDADRLVYAAGFGSQKSIDGIVTQVDPERYAFHKAKLMVKGILNKFKYDEYRLFLSSSDKTNFRYQVAKTPGPNGLGYKAGRKEKPKHYAAIRDYLERYWHAEVIYNMEADDKLAIEQTKYLGLTPDPVTGVLKVQYCDSIICSDDKDLLQVPGDHYRIMHDTIMFVEYLDSQRNLYKQILMGDRADNIPGIPGIGDIKSSRLLENCISPEEMELIVKQEYLGRHMTNYDEIYQLCYLKRTD